MKYLILLIGIVTSFAVEAQNDKAQKEQTPKSTNTTNKYHPFKINNEANDYSIQVEVEDPMIFKKYLPLFSKYGYSGNGYCWEGHIVQILEKLDPALLKHVNFDPEAGAFFAVCDSKVTQTKFLDLLAPIFSDLAKLEAYIKKANRGRIDD
jgi:hypothetical protein